MKRILLFVFLLFFFNTQAQVFNRVTHTSGTQTVGGKDVTVVSINGSAVASTCNGIGPYWIGSLSTNAPSGYLFSFAKPLTDVRFQITATNYGEQISFNVNGSPYMLTSANLSSFSAICSPPVCIYAPVIKSGMLQVSPGTLNACTQVDMHGSISSVQINNIDTNLNGSVFDFFVCFDTIAVFNQPFTDTVFCPNDNITIGYHTSAAFNNSNKFILQLSDVSGSFASATDIGVAIANTAGIIKGRLPYSASPGNAYRLRIISTSPVKISEDNGVNIRIKPLPPKPLVRHRDLSLCEKDTIFLYTDIAATPSVSYKWVGQGFNFATKDTFILNAAISFSGYYIISATDNINNCINLDTMKLLVKPLPAKPIAETNSPVCSDDTLHLNIVTEIAGFNYAWFGPDNFLSAKAKVDIIKTDTNASGSYVVTANLNGCSTSDSVSVIVKPTPHPRISTSSLINQGDDLLLHVGNTLPGTTYHWNGPDNFNATTADPVIYKTSFANAGKYTVWASLDGCTDSASIDIDMSGMLDLVLYPNPNNGNFTLFGHTHDEQQTKLKIFNTLGQHIYTDTAETHKHILSKQVQMPFVADGVYTVFIRLDNTNIRIPFVVIH